MKNHPILPALLLPTLLLASTGCPKKPQPQVALAQPGPALADTPPSSVAPAPASLSVDPFPEMTAALEAATPEKHEGLSAVQQRMDQAIDAHIAAWKANGHTVSLAADEKLDSATEDFAEKLRMLTLSSPEVWASAKHNTKLSLQSVQAAYAAIMQNPTRN